MAKRISDTEHIYVFRDIDENEKCRFNYQRNIDFGKAGYTRCMKMERRVNTWNLKNTRKKDLEVLKKVGFEPIMTTAG